MLFGFAILSCVVSSFVDVDVAVVYFVISSVLLIMLMYSFPSLLNMPALPFVLLWYTVCVRLSVLNTMVLRLSIQFMLPMCLLSVVLFVVILFFVVATVRSVAVVARVYVAIYHRVAVVVVGFVTFSVAVDVCILCLLLCCSFCWHARYYCYCACRLLLCHCYGILVGYVVACCRCVATFVVFVIVCSVVHV